MINILDGRKIAEEIKSELRFKVQLAIEQNGGIKPHLAVCLGGSDSASRIYVSKKQQLAEEIGFISSVIELAEDACLGKYNQVLQELNARSDVHGILLQLPLPKSIDPAPLILQLNPIKDVDGLHPFNLGMVTVDHLNLAPCTPSGIMNILEYYKIPLASRRVVILGRSRLVGKPMAQMMLNRDATVTIVHSKTLEGDLMEALAYADIVIAAVGIPEFVRGEWLKPGCTIIDVGINRSSDGKLVGDVHYQSACERAAAITPVPGGVGPLTVAHLMLNTLKAYQMQCSAS